MKKLILFLTFVLAYSLIYSQQWAGSTTTSGLITREGNVVIGGVGLSGSWSPNSRVLELQSIAGEMSFLAFREGGSNSTSFDIGFKSNNYAALYSNQVPMLFVTNGGERMRINTNGKIVIGQGVLSTPGTYNLYVSGGILTEKLKAALPSGSNWADYVFDSNYQLQPLSNVEAYIKTYKHLPGIPSASDLVKDSGIDVVQMFSKQMEKIEELTLYLINQNKQIESLKTRIIQLEKK